MPGKHEIFALKCKEGVLEKFYDKYSNGHDCKEEEEEVENFFNQGKEQGRIDREVNYIKIEREGGDKCWEMANVYHGQPANFNVAQLENENDDIIDNLTYLESSGLRYDKNIVFSEYNPYTSTGRPSNRFGGINFAALNKSDGSRAKFISRFGSKGKLVEFDYDAYHLRLIADKVGYKFSDASVHQHFADLFDITYQEAKVLSFQYSIEY